MNKKPEFRNRLQEKHPINWNRKESLMGDMSLSDLQSQVVDPINRNYGGHPGTKTNCMRCTMAYEMRRRGYDVESTLSWGELTSEQTSTARNLIMDPNFKPAAARTVKSFSDFVGPGHSTTVINDSHAWGNKTISLVKDGIHDDAIGKAKDVLDSIVKEGPGARGELGISWGAFVGGHSVAWEVMKDGTPVVIDNQSGKIYDTAEKLKQLMGPAAEAGYTRLDNVELNKEFLARWLADAES